MTQIAPGIYSLEQSKGGDVHAFCSTTVKI